MWNKGIKLIILATRQYINKTRMKKMLNTKLYDYRLNANWEYEKKIAEIAQK